MSQGKLLIISQVLKMERPFKAATIQHMAGLSNQLTVHHLKQLVACGALEKTDRYYSIIDKDALINEMVRVEDSAELHLARISFDHKEFNRRVDMAVAARVKKVPLASEIRHSLLREIEWQIRDLKNVRHYLNEKAWSPRTAARILEDFEEFFNAFKDTILPEMSRAQFSKQYEDAIERVVEEKEVAPVAKPEDTRFCRFALDNHLPMQPIVDGKCPRYKEHEEDCFILGG